MNSLLDRILITKATDNKTWLVLLTYKAGKRGFHTDMKGFRTYDAAVAYVGKLQEEAR